jgi:hypothetical protein
VTVTEPYSIDEIISAIDRQAAEDAWAYAMLYDPECRWRRNPTPG